MVSGYIEALKRGFRAVVYAGKDPLTGRKTYLKETHPTREAAERARDRLIARVEAEQIPDRAATVVYLLDRWTEVVDHELSTASTTAGNVRRTIRQGRARATRRSPRARGTWERSERWPSP